jgi:ABC-type multidrug transport system ATPase subunit
LPPEDGDDKPRILHAVKGTSFSLDKGESFALLGVNGAGKSTTFKCLAVDELVSDGGIRINGLDVNQLNSMPEKM